MSFSRMLIALSVLLPIESLQAKQTQPKLILQITVDGL